MHCLTSRGISIPVKSIASRSWWIFGSTTSKCHHWKQVFLGEGVQTASYPLPRQWFDTISWMMPPSMGTETNFRGGNLIQCWMRNRRGIILWQAVSISVPNIHGALDANTTSLMDHWRMLPLKSRTWRMLRTTCRSITKSRPGRTTRRMLSSHNALQRMS